MDSISQLRPPTFAEFEQEAKHGNVVAVTKTVEAGSIDPVDAFVNVAGSARYAFLLESVEGGEGVAKYSFIGADPYMIIRGRGNKTIIEKNGSHETHAESAAEYLQRHFRERQLANHNDLAPFAGGAVGYLGYRAANWFEPALNRQAESTIESGWDDALLMFYRSLVVFDRGQQQIQIVSVVFTEEAGASRTSLKELYEKAGREIERLEKLLALPGSISGQAAGGGLPGQQTMAPNPTVPAEPSSSDRKQSVNSNWTREGFEEAVRSVKESILAGDCYQAVISQRFKKTTAAEPFSIYRAMRKSNPSPYMYFLKLDDESIIGASPEMLVRCRSEQVDYRPIAGTRRRGATEAEDHMLAEEMRTDEKEVA